MPDEVERAEHYVLVSDKALDQLGSDWNGTVRLKAQLVPGSIGRLEFAIQKALDVSRTQDRIGKWADRNFGYRREGGRRWRDPLMGLVEEIGELHHAILKREQGIRGTPSEHNAAEEDAIGDLGVYLLDYCYARGWDFEEILMKTWNKVEQRDWKANALTGGEAPPSQ